MSGWVFVETAVAILSGGVWIAGERRWRRMAAHLAGRRPSPSREEFVGMLAGEVDEASAVWLWDELQVYYRPRLAPHPDDDLIEDMPIDPDEPEDWVRDYCFRHGIKQRQMSEWPKGLSVTPRHLLRWLDAERQRLTGR